MSVAEKLDKHLHEIIKWHFSDNTGCPFWLRWKSEAGWDPVKEIKTIDDIKKFPHFQDEWLRDGPLDKWVPQEYKGKPYRVFETGGTTGMPKGAMLESCMPETSMTVLQPEGPPLGGGP